MIKRNIFSLFLSLSACLAVSSQVVVHAVEEEITTIAPAHVENEKKEVHISEEMYKLLQGTSNQEPVVLWYHIAEPSAIWQLIFGGTAVTITGILFFTWITSVFGRSNQRNLTLFLLMMGNLIAWISIHYRFMRNVEYAITDQVVVIKGAFRAETIHYAQIKSVEHKKGYFDDNNICLQVDKGLRHIKHYTIKDVGEDWIVPFKIIDNKQAGTSNSK